MIQRQAFDEDPDSEVTLARDVDTRHRASASGAFGEARVGNDGRPCCLLVNLAGHGFEKIAPQLGWSCVSADTAGVAFDCLEHLKFSFVVVNVQGDKPTAVSLRRLVESRGGQDAAPFAVFGSEADAEDEIWARQLGVWFYLSGFPDGTGFQWLCDEALSVGDSVTAAA